jgi:serine protease Do
MTSGVVSAFRTDPNEGTHIQTDTALNPGNSGGPVLDLRGGIVGMAVSIMRDSEGLNFAIAGQELFDFYRQSILVCPLCPNQ